MSYFEEISEETKKLYEIYNDNPSSFIEEIIKAREMQRLNNISQASGIHLSRFNLCNYKYTKLDHSIGIAYILDRFTDDKKQVMTGLFYNVACPSFSNALRLMKYQTALFTRYDQIVGSDFLFDFFLKNKIPIKEVCDPSIYSLIESYKNRLNVVNLEFLLRQALNEKLCSIEEIREIYNDIVIAINEDNKQEFAFNTPDMGIIFSKISMEIGKRFRSYESKITMQIIADLLDLMIRRMELAPKDFYEFGERAILEIGINSSDRQISDGWNELLKLDKVFTRFTPVENEYCKKVPTIGNDYINPLVRTEEGYIRASQAYDNLSKEIEAYKNSDTDMYAYTQGLDFIK